MTHSITPQTVQLSSFPFAGADVIDISSSTSSTSSSASLSSSFSYSPTSAASITTVPSAEAPSSIIADYMTVVCNVVDAAGRKVNAAVVLAALNTPVSIDLSPADGTVVREHGRTQLVNESTGAEACIWANGKRLMISVNPTSWSQGYGAFCNKDPREVVMAAINNILQRLEVPDAEIVPSHLSTLHLTAMYDTGSVDVCNQLMRALRAAGIMGSRIVTIEENGVYFGKHSHQRSAKVYHDPNKQAYGYSCPEYMGRMIRIEIVLHNCINLFGDVADWFQAFENADLYQIYASEASMIRCLTNPIVLEITPPGLTNTEVGILARWKNHDLPTDKSSIKYHRRKILSKIGVDIARPYTEDIGLDIQQRLSFEALLSEHNITGADHYPAMSCGRIVDPLVAAAAALHREVL